MSYLTFKSLYLLGVVLAIFGLSGMSVVADTDIWGEPWLIWGISATIIPMLYLYLMVFKP